MFSDVLLTVDHDRTLTAPDSTIPARNLEAIRYFMENGGTFTMNTGRSIPMALRNILGIVPNNAPLLLYNGSADYDEKAGRFTRYAPIELDYAKLLPELQLRFPMLNIEVQAIDAHYLMRKDAGWEAYCDNNGCPWKYAAPEDIPGPFIKFSFYGEFRENTVASMYTATEEELAAFAEMTAYMEENYGDKIEIFRACPRIADIHAKGVSKGNAARLLQKQLGKKILICVGDAENDLTMLENTDFAFCPADGRVADRFPNVCNCADGAVADVIYNKIPEILKNRP
ncbi:MAG: HAD-IIB family hydrolase [Ruminococcaceae bacterium]|nr:HAD-IIB family hydrolase [Oscillospiraceae bacterium]